MVLLHSLNQKYNKYLYSVKIQKSIQRHCLSERRKLKRYQKVGDRHCSAQAALPSLDRAV